MLHKVSFREVDPNEAHTFYVAQSGGDICTSSQEISLLRPQARSSPPQSIDMPSPHATIHPSQKRILIIDDSPTVRKILEACLRREHFSVKSFADGVEALRWLKEQQCSPDLVWLDIGLPRMDGYEVGRYFKAQPQFKNTAVVMMSGRGGTIDRLKSRLAGAKGYVTKPFKTQQIVAITKLYTGISTDEQEAVLQLSRAHG